MGLVHAGFKDIITPAGVLGSVPLVIGRRWSRDPPTGSSIVMFLEVPRHLPGGEK